MKDRPEYVWSMDAEDIKRHAAAICERNHYLMAENRMLSQENRELKAKVAAMWETVEDVACGTQIECVVCGGYKPCMCDKS